MIASIAECDVSEIYLSNLITLEDRINESNKGRFDTRFGHLIYHFQKDVTPNL